MRYSRWKLVFETVGGTVDWKGEDDTTVCSNVEDSTVVLEPFNRRFVKSFRSAIDECVRVFFFSLVSRDIKGIGPITEIWRKEGL